MESETQCPKGDFTNVAAPVELHTKIMMECRQTQVISKQTTYGWDLFLAFHLCFFPTEMPQPLPEVWASTRRWQGDPHHALRVKTAELMLSAPEGAPLEQSVAATIKDPGGVCNVGVVIAGKHGIPFGHCRV